MTTSNNDKRILNVPPLRFPEFKGEWEKDKASALLECFPTNSITWEDLNFDGGTMRDLHYGLIHKGFNKSVMPADSKLIPWINSGKEPKKYTKIKDGDLILADASEDTNECGEPVELFGCLNSNVVSGLHTIHCRDKKNFSVPGFKAYLFQSGGIKKQLYRLCEGTKIYSISPSTLNEIVLNFPSNEEQHKIVKLLNFIEQRIVVQRKIIKDLSDLIVSIRSYLFNGSAETSSMSLDSLFGLVTSRNTSEKPLIVFSACGQKGLIPENLYYKKKISSASTKNYFEIENNDYVYSKSSSAGFPFGSFNRFEGTEGLVSPLYIVLRPKKTINSEYLETWFKSDNCKKQLRQICQEGARNHGLLNISTKDFLSLEIPVIDLNNQMRLISLCKARLALSTAELDSLSRLKSFLLSSLFC